MKHEVDELYLLLYQENIDLYSWKYKLYDIKDNQVKHCKKTNKYHAIIDDQNKNIVCNLD